MTKLPKSSVFNKLVMAELDEEEEANIDNMKNEVLLLTKGERTFRIRPIQIVCYGEVDFNNTDDLKKLDSFRILDSLGGVGISIPSRYDYDNHRCYSPIRKYQITETWSLAELAKYNHGCLNKPKRIIIFKM